MLLPSCRSERLVKIENLYETTRRRMSRASHLFRDLCRRDDALEVFGDVEIRLVERQWLDDRRVFGKDIPDLQRDRLVGVESGLNEDQIGAFSLGVIDGIAECTPNLRAS